MAVKQTVGRDLSSQAVQKLIDAAIQYTLTHAENYAFFVKSKGSEMGRFGLTQKGQCGLFITDKDAVLNSLKSGKWIYAMNGEQGDALKQTCHQIDRLRQAFSIPRTIIPFESIPDTWEDFETETCRTLNRIHYMGLAWEAVGRIPGVRFDVMGTGKIAGKDVSVRFECKFHRGRV